VPALSLADILDPSLGKAEIAMVARTTATVRMLGALTLAFLAVPAPAEEPARSFDPSALRFAPPASFESLVGAYRYTTRLGDIRTLRLELDPGGEKRLLASRAGKPRDLLLSLEPDPEGPGLRGQARRDFDPCLALAALVHTLPLAADELVLELSVIYPRGGLPPLPHECPAGPEWMLLSPPGQPGVAVYPVSSYRPATDSSGPLTEVGPGVSGEYSETIDQITRGQRESESHSEFDTVLNPPRVPGGTRVRVTRSIRTSDGETWLQVQVLAPEEGEPLEGLDDDPWLDDPEAEGTDAGEEEPPVSSGYVRPEHVHARLSYTLVRVVEP
jgi:hypothetical protein